MSPTDAEATRYDAYYFRHSCGRPYQPDAEWRAFFGRIADRILSDIAPRTVLDAGCAIGLLVEALRARGVEAYGIDLSEYAIGRVPEPIREYCRLGSVLDPFPSRYDLVVSIEVVEHLPPDEGRAAVANMCRHTDDVLFSSSPTDYGEATHLNVQAPGYWADLFAGEGFLRDVDFDASFIVPWARRFRRTGDPPQRVLAAYERRLWRLEEENAAIRRQLLEQRGSLARREEEADALATRVREADEAGARLREELAAATAAGPESSDLRARLDAAEAELEALQRTRLLRYSRPARRLYAILRGRAGRTP